MSKIPPSVIALIAIVILVLLGWAVLPSADTIGDEFRLPVIAVFAMAAMFAVLAFIAAIYKSADMASSGQALGLPEGSVRALIALSLIVIFAVITLFMLTRLTESKEYCSELVALLHQQEPKKADTSEPKQSLAGTVTAPNAPTTSSGGGGGGSQPTTNGPSGGGGGGTPAGGSGGGAPAVQTQTSGGTQSSVISEAIAGVNKRQDAAQDLAKQLLTMLGTLLAAVSSFYFGSSATSSAVAAAGRGNPDPTSKPQSPVLPSDGGAQGQQFNAPPPVVIHNYPSAPIPPPPIRA